ncbi:HlyD family type I secretion periplasmic adaptor subunit [Aestuariispira insulae]|uniref:Membrane fusion protein (MFP) family protein n=1 Tax=Aestuariispira insulae TaxID=1461337 RepID=A0A3D9HR85_9PROT|nr:HlyD family type I secretion periplasmic adaptor subunit [Aestuariispira insulae]RED52013.1 epimerase transport system membrane fusion protein [Aestuariispira insulae]
MTDTPTLQKPDAPAITRPALAGAAVTALFFGGLIAWSSLAPLDSAAVAPGKIVVEGQRKTVQHLEGGIIAEILVRDGDYVEEGRPLVRLDDTKAKAMLGLLSGRRMEALAVEARLRAERDSLGQIRFPDDLLKLASDPTIADIVQNQKIIFQSRQASLKGQIAILRQRNAQYREEIKGIQGQMAAETRQLELIDREIKNVQSMVDKGLARVPRLLQLQRQAAQILGSKNMHHAQIARAQQSIGETDLRITELSNQSVKEVMEQLKLTQAELRDLNERIHASLDVLERTEVRAPISGTVVGLQIHSKNGVVAPGSNLMDIVPNQGNLIIQARIAPKDIDIVRIGQNAQVRISAFNQRTAKPLDAQLLSISADRLVDEKTGEEFYQAELSLLKTDDSIATVELVPGMEAETFIHAGRKTMLEYLFEPISKGFNRAFRES